ncbi:hypothetical protein SAMN03080614_11093, partial [Anaerobranca gottschalkii DSM 13577]
YFENMMFFSIAIDEKCGIIDLEKLNTTDIYLQGRVKFPTGGKARELFHLI